MSILHDYTYRVLVAGDSGVGKTHLISNYIEHNDISNQIFRPTIGVDFHAKLITSGTKKIKLHIWDTSGDHNFKNIVRAYYTSVAAAILVYDIANRESFENIKNWLEELREKNKNLCDIPILVLGNHKDGKKRQVEYNELERFGELYNTFVSEISCDENLYLEEILQPLWEKVTNKFVIPEKYNPGVKRLEKRIFLSNKTTLDNSFLTKSSHIPLKFQENQYCSIS